MGGLLAFLSGPVILGNKDGSACYKSGPVLSSDKYGFACFLKWACIIAL